MTTTKQAVEFVRRHGVVLESARGPVPNLAEAIAGKAIRGSWWAHPKGRATFRIANAVREIPDVLVSRLVDGNVTYAHRRVWPALVRLAPALGAARLAAIYGQRRAPRGHDAFPSLGAGGSHTELQTNSRRSGVANDDVNPRRGAGGRGRCRRDPDPRRGYDPRRRGGSRGARRAGAPSHAAARGAPAPSAASR